MAASLIKQHKSFISQYRIYLAEANTPWRVPHLGNQFFSPGHRPFSTTNHAGSVQALPTNMIAFHERTLHGRGDESMYRKIDAHFDGKAIIPDDPVDLPVGQRLRVQIELADTVTPRFADLLGFTAELEDAPVDLAAQHDHYLYGTPKR
jgi:hypothetical protein